MAAPTTSTTRSSSKVSRASYTPTLLPASDIPAIQVSRRTLVSTGDPGSSRLASVSRGIRRAMAAPRCGRHTRSDMTTSRRSGVKIILPRRRGRMRLRCNPCRSTIRGAVSPAEIRSRWLRERLRSSCPTRNSRRFHSGSGRRILRRGI